MRITKPKITMRLYWESKDLTYDKEDRVRYSKIRRIINKVPTKAFGKCFIKNRNYDYYRGFCYAREIKEVLNENDFDILIAVIDNIKEGYYDKKD